MEPDREARRRRGVGQRGRRHLGAEHPVPPQGRPDGGARRHQRAEGRGRRPARLRPPGHDLRLDHGDPRRLGSAGDAGRRGHAASRDRPDISAGGRRPGAGPVGQRRAVWQGRAGNPSAAMKHRMSALITAVVLVACASSHPQATATARPPSPTPTVSPRAPITLPADPSIEVMPGFAAWVYASGLPQPTAMAFGPDGRLYVTGAGGTISVVPAPGAAVSRLVSGLPAALGLVWRDQDLFVSVRGSIRAYHLQDGGLTGGVWVVGNLPTGRHQNDNLVRLPNGDFLLGIGSTCDVCNEADPRSASVVRFHADWSFAGGVVRGARNPYGLALRPATE